MYDTDTKLPLIRLNTIDGYLTIPLNPKTLINHIFLTSPTLCDNLHAICSHFNKRKIQKLLTHSTSGRSVSISPARFHFLLRTLKDHTDCQGCRQSMVSKNNHEGILHHTGNSSTGTTQRRHAVPWKA